MEWRVPGESILELPSESLCRVWHIWNSHSGSGYRLNVADRSPSRVQGYSALRSSLVRANFPSPGTSQKRSLFDNDPGRLGQLNDKRILIGTGRPPGKPISRRVDHGIRRDHSDALHGLNYRYTVDRRTQ